MRILMLGMILLAPTIKLAEEPKTQTLREQYDALLKEYETALSTFTKSIPPGLAQENPLWIKMHESLPDFTFAPRFLQFAEANPRDPVAVDALLQILKLGWSREKAIYPSLTRARDILIRDFLLDPRVIKSCLAKPVPDGLGMEPYFRALLAKSTDHEVLGRACMALVRCHETRSGIAARPYFDYSPLDHPERAAISAYLTSRLDPDYVRSIRETDTVALADEIESLLERVAEEFGDVPFLPRELQAKRKEDRSLADVAKQALKAIQSLGVGQVAPEIEGTGLDGKPMKLSDFRGKVVMLVFWGTWCGPCMRMVPHENEIVERLKGRPFALVGVDSEVDSVKSQAIMKEKGITWPSFQDGEPSRGPIARRWNIRGWPTIYILDEKGVIRFKNLPHHVPQLINEKIDGLLQP